MNKIGIIGTGGFAREVLCLIDDLHNYDQVKAFFEPDDVWEQKWKEKKIMGKKVLPYSDLKPNDDITIGIGNSIVREKIYKELGNTFNYINLIHPSVNVSKWCNLGKGVTVTSGCILTSQIIIGDFCQLNLHSTIGHDCNIDTFFTTAPSVNISGECTLGKHVYFGTGAATRQGITICDHVTLGMGSMVVKSIMESGVYVGIPAKKLN